MIRPPAHGGTAQLPAIIERKPQIGWQRLAAAAAVVVILLAAAAFIFRQEIISTIAREAGLGRQVSVAASPPSRANPAKIAVPDPPARAELEIDVANSTVELVDGRYVVRGEIVNNGRATGSTSTLKLVFKKDNDVLGERSYSLIEGPIAPGDRLSFRQPLDEPPEGTTDIVPAIE